MIARTFSKVKKNYTGLLDQKVKVLYKETATRFTAYLLSEDYDVLSGLLGDFEKDGSKLKFDGSKYSVGCSRRRY